MPKDPFADIISDIHGMLLKKHNDYGPKNLDEFGTLGILIRISDKLNRVKNMIQSGKDGGLVGEKEEQEWLDIAGYAIQALRIKRKGHV